MDPPDLPLLLLLIFASTINTRDLVRTLFCNTADNFNNNTFQDTLNALFSSISTPNSSSLTYSFFNDSAPIARASETLYVIGSCRGDLTAKSCRRCLSGSAIEISSSCLNKKEVVLCKENCTARYSNASIFGTVRVEPVSKSPSMNNVTSPNTYNAALKPLLVDLQGKAATGGLLRKYVTRNTSTGFEKIYAMTQCMLDLTVQQCSDCLVNRTGTLGYYC